MGAIAVWGGIRLALNTPYPILVVSSPSMCAPTNCVLPVGALVVIHGSDPSSVSLGQIIVFRNNPATPDFLVIHRVVGIVPPNETTAPFAGEYGFKTKGDNNAGPDCWTSTCYIPGSWIVGIYQFTIPIPYLGSAILDIRDFMYNSTTGQVNPQGILIILALIVALFAFEVATPNKKHPQEVKEAEDGSKPQSEESAGSINPSDSSSSG